MYNYYCCLLFCYCYYYRSWYNAVVYNGMKEIVVFLDLNQQGINGNSSDSLLRESAINVILSLSIKDKVMIMGVA